MEEDNIQLPRLAPTEDELEQAHQNWLDWEKNNPNNFSKWFPFFNGRIKTPKSLVVPVPDDMVSHFVCENCKVDTPIVEDWIEQNVLPRISETFGSPEKLFFKNGCFSNKFDFSASCLLETIDAHTIAEHLFNIEQAAFCFDTCGDMELVFREWIESAPGTPTIYRGMPFRPEMRVFYDFGQKKILYDKFYWDWDYCYPHMVDTEDEDEYTEAYPVVFDEYLAKRTAVLRELETILPSVEGMEGIWSVDILMNGSEFWMIDAALAWQSAYWDPDLAGIRTED